MNNCFSSLGRSGCAGRPAQPDLLILFLALSCMGAGAEVPKSPYAAIVYRYGDAIIKNNRDTHNFGQNDLRLLYTLSELSNKPVYRDAADADLKWMMQNVPEMRDVEGTWMLWDRCFQIAPDDSRIVATKSESMRALAAVYQQTKAEDLLKRMESALTPGKRPVERISLAIQAWGVAGRVSEPLASKLRQFAKSQDEAFL